MSNHGTQTCPGCGGYVDPLGTSGRALVSQCRNCGGQTSQPFGNDLDDFLKATVENYDEN